MNWKNDIRAFAVKYLFWIVLACVVITYLVIVRFTGTCTVCGAIKRAAGASETGKPSNPER